MPGRPPGIPHSEEAKAKMRLGHARRKAKVLRDTACSLCYEFARAEDYDMLRPLCKDRTRCIIRKLWSKFLIEFKRI